MARSGGEPCCCPAFYSCLHVVVYLWSKCIIKLLAGASDSGEYGYIELRVWPECMLVLKLSQRLLPHCWATC